MRCCDLQTSTVGVQLSIKNQADDSPGRVAELMLTNAWPQMKGGWCERHKVEAGAKPSQAKPKKIEFRKRVKHKQVFPSNAHFSMFLPPRHTLCNANAMGSS